MKLGFVSAILEECDFKQVVDTASDFGFQCIEMACWPKEKAKRRYAGVSHIDTENLTEEKAHKIRSYLQEKNIEISALAYYPNPMDENLESRERALDHLNSVMHAAKLLGIEIVATFIGRAQNKTVEENLQLFEKIWTPVIKKAEELHIKIAIENCPMYFGREQWPAGQNIAYSPEVWKEMFKRIPSEYFGLNYDPSHFIWQQMDYIAPLYEFKHKIFHIHYKDIKLYPEKLKARGILSYPLEYMSPKLPGLGDVNWKEFISALKDISYTGNTCIEIEDKAYEDTLEKKKDSLLLSKHYIEQYL